MAFIHRTYGPNEISLNPPACGVKPNSPYCHDSKQVFQPLNLQPEFDKVRKVFRDAYRCECESSKNSEQFGRSIPSNRQETKLVELEINKVRSLTKASIPKTKTKFGLPVLEEEYKCPWLSFYEPLFVEIAKYLQLEKIPGTRNIGPSTEAVVYEGVLYYKKCYEAIDIHIKVEEFKKREAQRNKSGQNTGVFTPPKW